MATAVEHSPGSLLGLKHEHPRHQQDQLLVAIIDASELHLWPGYLPGPYRGISRLVGFSGMVKFPDSY